MGPMKDLCPFVKRGLFMVFSGHIRGKSLLLFMDVSFSASQTTMTLIAECSNFCLRSLG
ncbi:hypothetical protein DITRI_Ditri09bG0114900 [Diplodiscus trichospermus]